MFDKSKIAVGAKKGAPRIVLIGVEGVGKSTAAAQCPKPIILTAEDGLVGQGFDGVEHYSPPDWPAALEFLTWVRDADHGYKSLVVDTIDWLEPLLVTYICARDKKKDIEDYGYGKGYVIAADEFRKALAILEDIHKKGILVMINAHCQVKPYNNPLGDNYDRYELKCSKHIAGIIKEWSDTILFANYQTFAVKDKGSSKAKGVGGQVRIVYTEYCAAWDAKNRYGLPAEIPFDMRTILDAIEHGVPDSPENIIAEINALLPKLGDAVKRKAITDFVAQNAADALKLSQALNRIRTLTQEVGE